MRTIINIADSQIKILDQLSKKKKVSIDKIIRQALASYIANHDHNNKAFENAFGLWKDKNLDSLEYQTKLRNEWNE
ncbi:ribbon-helix-helix domain-containing protein [Rickettsia hoogstraalii]|uniref:ribbon-helix-helix domain-containing protein n=1 Tax=Rickettsia hoogstraalii TaxID=467174 RepID=UPI002257D29F|nr:CopG family transcriptional regulator [Rickettsia hoogstraalii]MCX4083406.1 ribbon-helix-helix domain-containing protein [Rickettsia hoogstraalii]